MAGRAASAELGREGCDRGAVAGRKSEQIPPKRSDRKWQSRGLLPPLSASPRGGSEPPSGEKPFLITEPCQSAVGEDDEIIKHFPCVFFIRPVCFPSKCWGNRTEAPLPAAPQRPPPAGAAAERRSGAPGGTGSDTFLMEIMICKALFIPFDT